MFVKQEGSRKSYIIWSHFQKLVKIISYKHTWNCVKYELKNIFCKEQHVETTFYRRDKEMTSGIPTVKEVWLESHNQDRLRQLVITLFSILFSVILNISFLAV